MNNSIYGTNDAARAWYLSIRSVLFDTGWEALVFEPASSVMHDSKRNLVAVMIMHVDDFLMAIRPNLRDRVVGLLQKRVGFASLKSCQQEKVTSCGREYIQHKDYVHRRYQHEQVPRQYGNLPCTPTSRPHSGVKRYNESEHRGYRKLIGQLSSNGLRG